jgi:acetolactate synthase-1/2/3 large subunit
VAKIDTGTCDSCTGSFQYSLTHNGFNDSAYAYCESSYAVLRAEIERVGARVEPGLAESLLDIGEPDIDWVALARGLGVEATRASTAEAFDDCLAAALRRRGPLLIEAVLSR